MNGYKNYSGIIRTRSGKEYPDFALGTYQRSEDELVNLMKTYSYDKLMIDTAYRYGNEDAVSRAIIASGYPTNQIIHIGKINTNQQESGKTIREEFIGTLHRLCLSKIDIYLIHSNRSPNYCVTWKEMLKLQEEGLINTIGVSNFSIEDIEQLYRSSGVYPEINQIAVPIVGTVDDVNIYSLIEYCNAKKILIQAAMPFGGSEKSSLLTTQQRQNILTCLRRQNISCILGTSNIDHLYQSLSWIELGR